MDICCKPNYILDFSVLIGFWTDNSKNIQCSCRVLKLGIDLWQSVVIIQLHPKTLWVWVKYWVWLPKTLPTPKTQHFQVLIPKKIPNTQKFWVFLPNTLPKPKNFWVQLYGRHPIFSQMVYKIEPLYRNSRKVQLNRFRVNLLSLTEIQLCNLILMLHFVWFEMTE